MSADEDTFELVRPAEFATDRDWALSLAEDAFVLRERLDNAEWALDVVAGAMRGYQQEKASIDAYEELDAAASERTRGSHG